MARIRTIKPEFWTSEAVTQCSLLARLLFIGMWNFADDHGVFPARMRQLRALVFPLDEVNGDAMEDAMAELIKAELVGKFDSEGRDYWGVRGWQEHQKIDRPSYKHPPPPWWKGRT